MTTRTTWVSPVIKGQPWLLFLRGKEPYQFGIGCGHSAPLQDALLDVKRLYQEFEVSRYGA